MKRKGKKFGDGGDVREGRNENIDDDTRARAMAWLKKQQEGGDDNKDEVSRATKTRRAVKNTPTSKEASIDTSMDETARLMRRNPVVDRAVPSDLAPSEVGSGVSGGPSMADVGRNVSNTLAALGPGIAGAAVRGLGALAGAGARGIQRGSDIAQRARAIKAAGDARRARYVEQIKENPILDYSGLAPELPFKKGGKVKKMAKGGAVKSGSASRRADGIAQRGKTRGKVI